MAEPAITSRQSLIEALTARNADARCPSCNETRWRVLARSSLGETFKLVDVPPLPIPRQVLSLIIIYCDHCGLIRSYLGDILEHEFR